MRPSFARFLFGFRCRTERHRRSRWFVRGARRIRDTGAWLRTSRGTWWNHETGTCVRMHLQNGRYSRIDRLKPSACGQTSPASPQDVSSIPARALRACSRRDDRYRSARGGASVVRAAERTGPTWLLTMSTRHYILKCTVTASAREIRMESSKHLFASIPAGGFRHCSGWSWRPITRKVLLDRLGPSQAGGNKKI